MQQTMIQYFQWYLPDDGTLYRNLARDAAHLARTGFTSVWMPPACKGSAGRYDVGYGIYDLYDLGEFKQKGIVRTKYGTKAQYLKCIQTLQNKGLEVIADVVLNHKMGADATEDIRARKMNDFNRNMSENDLHDVTVWTRYLFEGRNGKYSDFQWNWTHFTGTDYDAKTGQRGILEFEGKNWNLNVSQENGNYDFVMGCDIDYNNQEVLRHLYQWGKWYVDLTGVNGFRLDAIKSIDSHFFNQWLETMHKYGNHPKFAVGEYWSGNVWDLKGYLDQCHYSMRLMDVPLHYHLMQASMSNGTYDIRHLYHYTLADTDPNYAVCFVDNHDTQPGQSLESWVLDWFKPQAYAAILLNKVQIPCVFYGDLYGIESHGKMPVRLLEEMVWIRHNLLSDNIVDLYDEDTQKACWMAYSMNHPVLVIYTIADWKEKYVHEPRFAGMSFEEVGNPSHTETFDKEGNGRITCPPGSLSIYITTKDARALKKAMKSPARARKSK